VNEDDVRRRGNPRENEEERPEPPSAQISLGNFSVLRRFEIHENGKEGKGGGKQVYCERGQFNFLAAGMGNYKEVRFKEKKRIVTSREVKDGRMHRHIYR